MKCKDCHYFKDKKCKILDFVGYENKINYIGDEEVAPTDKYFEVICTAGEYRSILFYRNNYCEENNEIWGREIESCILNKKENCKYFIDKNIYCTDCEYHSYGQCDIENCLCYDIEEDCCHEEIRVKNKYYKEIFNNSNINSNEVWYCILNKNKDCKWFKKKEIVNRIINKIEDKNEILRQKIFKEFGEY